jgi:hypothetical protein
VPLPVEIPAGQAVIVALMVASEHFNYTTLGRLGAAGARGAQPREVRSAFSECQAAGRPADAGGARGTTPQPSTQLPSTPPLTIDPVTETHGLTVHLDFRPGPDRSVQVPVVSGGVAGLAGDRDAAPGWRVLLEVNAAGAVQGMNVGLPPSAALSRLTVTLWRTTRAASSLTVTRPLRNRGGECVPFGSLPSGEYEWSVRQAGQTVSVGSFRTPCPPDEDWARFHGERPRETTADACE